MKKYTFALIAVLTGCSSPGDLRMKSPYFDQTVAAQSEQLTGCISDQLESMFKRSVSARPTANGGDGSRGDANSYWSATGILIFRRRSHQCA